MENDPRFQSLSPTERHVFHYLCWRCGGKNRTWVSVPTIENGTGLSRRSIYNALKRCEELGILRQERHGNTVFRYPLQSDQQVQEVHPLDEIEQVQEVHKEVQEVHSQVQEVHLAGAGGAPKVKENIKEKNKKKSNIVQTESREAFDAFWSVYPKKAGKAAALRNFMKLSNEDQSAAIEGAMRYAEQRAGEDPAYTKMAQGWLTDRRWEDQLQSKPDRTLSLLEKAQRAQTQIKDITPHDGHDLPGLSAPHQSSEIEDRRVLSILHATTRRG